MNPYYLQKLEFNKILEILSGYCSTYIGKNIAMELSPYHDADTVSKLLSETRRGCEFIVLEIYSIIL